MRRVLTAVLMVCCLVLNLFVHGNVAASEQKTVRVGYVLYKGYQEGAEGMPKSGYGYEYLQEIAYYAGWHYEYVYGSFSELMNKLEKGEIDLMGNLSYTPARARGISFGSEEQGREHYYLYAREDRFDIRPDNPSTLNGMRIGVAKGSLQAELFNDWLAKNNIQCELIMYEQSAKRMEDMNSGRLDATVSTNVIDDSKSKYHWYSVAKIGESPYYFGVSKQRPDLLQELNAAHRKVLQSDWYYNEKVYLKYYGNNSYTSSSLFPAERLWLAQRGRIIVGYVNNSLPYASWDNKKQELVGILAVYKEHVENRYRISLEAKPFATHEELRRALEDGTVDAAYPAYGSYWLAEKMGLMATNPLSSTYLMLVYKGSYSDQTTASIAVSENSSLQQYCAQELYPNAKLVRVKSREDCIKAVTDGRANSTLATADSYYAYRNDWNELYDCNIINTGHEVPVGFVVREGDIATYSFMKKSLSGIGSETISKALTEGGYAVPEPSIRQFLGQHIFWVLLLGFAVTALIVAFIMHYMLTKRREASLCQYNLELNKKIYIDFATGLPNKNKCEEMLGATDAITKPTACFMFDLNDLKVVNDTLGHEMGDMMIYSFANLLCQLVPGKYFVGRFGGDEFIMIAEGISGRREINSILRDMERLVKHFNDTNTSFKLSYAAGFAYSGDHKGLSLLDLLHVADEDMYANKKAMKAACDQK